MTRTDEPMEFRPLGSCDRSAIEELFVSVFATSEGEHEGALVGGLASALATCTDQRNVYGFAAVEREQIVGGLFLSRLIFDEPLEAFILAPVAVRCGRQGTGVGKAMIAHSLREMTRRGVSFVATYGDPAFYRKVGFVWISSEVVRPPYELTQPEGWPGQSLGDESLESWAGRCSCVEALNHPSYW